MRPPYRKTNFLDGLDGCCQKIAKAQKCYPLTTSLANKITMGVPQVSRVQPAGALGAARGEIDRFFIDGFVCFVPGIVQQRWGAGLGSLLERRPVQGGRLPQRLRRRHHGHRLSQKVR